MLHSNCHVDQPRNLVRRLRCAQEGRAVDVFQARVLQQQQCKRTSEVVELPGQVRALIIKLPAAVIGHQTATLQFAFSHQVAADRTMTCRQAWGHCCQVAVVSPRSRCTSQDALLCFCRGHAQQLVHLQQPGVPSAGHTAHPKTHAQFVGLLQSARGEGWVMWTLQAQQEPCQRPDVDKAWFVAGQPASSSWPGMLLT